MGIAVRSWSDRRYSPVSAAVDSALQPRQESQAVCLSAALHVRSAQICKCPSFSFHCPIHSLPVAGVSANSKQRPADRIGQELREMMQLANSQSEKIIKCKRVDSIQYTH